MPIACRCAARRCAVLVRFIVIEPAFGITFVGQDEPVIAPINRLWRDAWPSKPRCGAFLCAYAAVGAAVGSLIGATRGDAGMFAALGLLTGYFIGAIWMFAAIATESRSAQAWTEPDRQVFVKPTSNVRSVGRENNRDQD